MRFNPTNWIMGIFGTLFVGGILAWGAGVSAKADKVNEIWGMLQQIEIRLKNIEEKL